MEIIIIERFFAGAVIVWAIGFGLFPLRILITTIFDRLKRLKIFK